MSVPAELKRREDRLAAIAEAKGKIEARAAERYAREQTDYQAKLTAREAKAAASGKKPGGKAPKPPEPGPRAKDQINLTDEASRIMVVAGGGFEPCYNAQAVVDTATMRVLVPQVTQAANDKQQVVPMVEKLQALPAGLNRPDHLVADAGYFSAANVDACAAAGIAPLMEVKRDEHPPGLRALRRTTRTARHPDSGATHDPPAQDRGRQGRLCAAQEHRRAGLWHHQSRDGLPPVPHPRTGQRPRRIDSGVPGVESKTHGRMASAVREKPEKRAVFLPKNVSFMQQMTFGWPSKGYFEE
jgi:hypothetical protein